MFPLCKWGAIGKNDNGYPLALCYLCGNCHACSMINNTPWLLDQPQDKMRRYAMNIIASDNNAYRRG